MNIAGHLSARARNFIALVAFAVVAGGGWIGLAAWSVVCWDGVDSEGHWVGECYHDFGPIQWALPLVLGAVVAVAIRTKRR